MDVSYLPRTVWNSLSRDAKELTACVVVPAKIESLASIKCVQLEHFRVNGHAALFASLSPTILEGMGCRG